MASRRELVALLGEIPLFERCTKRSLTTIARHIETVDVAGGKTLVKEGADGDAFFVLLDGEAQVILGGATGEMLGRGDHFGELALLSPAPRSATVVARSDVSVAVLGARMFRTLMREYPDLSEQLMSALAGQLRDVRAELRQLEHG